MIRKLVTGKAANTRVEFLRFLPVGGVTTALDFGLLILLTELLGVHYLISAAVSFIAGQTWSYVMCVKWVFAKFKPKGHLTGYTAFLILSSVGLLITELFLWYFTEEVGLHYLFSKIIASAVAFLTLFLIRKKLLFS